MGHSLMLSLIYRCLPRILGCHKRGYRGMAALERASLVGIDPGKRRSRQKTRLMPNHLDVASAYRRLAD